MIRIILFYFRRTRKHSTSTNTNNIIGNITNDVQHHFIMIQKENARDETM